MLLILTTVNLPLSNPVMKDVHKNLAEFCSFQHLLYSKKVEVTNITLGTWNYKILHI